MARAHTVHVLPDGTGKRWHVCHRDQVLSGHATQEEAMKAGRRIARRTRVDLVTWGCDGRIQSKDSYGNESDAPDNEH